MAPTRVLVQDLGLEGDSYIMTLRFFRAAWSLWVKNPYHPSPALHLGLQLLLQMAKHVSLSRLERAVRAESSSAL